MSRRKRHLKVYALVTLSLIAVSLAGGWLLERMISGPAQHDTITSEPAAIEKPAQTAEAEQLARGQQTPEQRLFELAVSRMQQGDYQRAAQHWHEFLMLVPTSADAHVNMGFSMFELGRMQMAARSFQNALDLNAYQTNAYYGLAISLEELGDIEGALGAMRSFVHLSDSDDPYLRKANSAIWEWQSEIDRRRMDAQPDSQDTSENASDPSS